MMLGEPPPPGATARIEAFMEFLRSRKCRDGLSVLDLLGDAESRAGGWYRFECNGLGKQEDASEASAEIADHSDIGKGLEGQWKRAWHGCKLEAVYSILYHGRLLESRCSEYGQEWLEGAPGVNFHDDKTQRKAEGYMHWVELFGDGVF